jgi:hypothetical protein
MKQAETVEGKKQRQTKKPTPIGILANDWERLEKGQTDVNPGIRKKMI